MTEIAEQTGRGAGGAEQSTAEQAKEKVQDTAQQVQEKAQEKAYEVKSQAGGRIRQEIDTRSTDAGSQLRSTAEAMRRSGEQLQQEGKDGPAKVTSLVADRAERLGDYMTAANADRILRDIEQFARRQPWLVAIGSAAAGFLASRFLKASSGSRYASEATGTNGRQHWQPATGASELENVGYATSVAAERGGAGGQSGE